MNLDQGRQNVEQHEPEKKFNTLRSAFNSPSYTAGLAVEGKRSDKA